MTEHLQSTTIDPPNNSCTRIQPLKKRPLALESDQAYSTVKKTKLDSNRPIIHAPIANRLRPPSDKTLIEQLYIIFEGCLSLFVMAETECPECVPDLLVNACDLLYQVKESKTPERPLENAIAGACLWITCHFHSESISRLAAGSIHAALIACDKNLTRKLLSKAQKWALKALNYDVWYSPRKIQQSKRRPLLELDKDLDTRNLRELGFLAEQMFYPPSIEKNTFHDPVVIQKYIDNFPTLKIMQTRLRSFCSDPVKFREENYNKKEPSR